MLNIKIDKVLGEARESDLPQNERGNNMQYAVGDRVIYPGKAGYVLICTTAGTSDASAPSFPASVTSGTTTLVDGSAVWTIYDATKPEIATVNGLTGALSAKADKAAVALRADSAAYSAGDRVIYPGKAGYVLICTTAGTSDASAPSFPASVTSGTTTISDGSAVWTIYDAAQAPGSGSGFGRWDPAGWTSVTKHTTYQASGDGWLKVVRADRSSPSAQVYLTFIDTNQSTFTRIVLPAVDLASGRYCEFVPVWEGMSYSWNGGIGLDVDAEVYFSPCL